MFVRTPMLVSGLCVGALFLTKVLVRFASVPFHSEKLKFFKKIINFPFVNFWKNDVYARADLAEYTDNGRFDTLDTRGVGNGRGGWGVGVHR